MNLTAAVERFTLDTITDPYGVGASIKGHLSVYDDEKSSGSSTRRRVLETLPTYTMFSSNCISHQGVIYIVGEPTFDYYRGYAVRAKYAVAPSDKTYKIDSISNILAGTVTSTSSYASLEQSRNSIADSESSSATVILNAVLPNNTDVSKGNILFTGSEYYRVRSNSYIDGAGFRVVEVVQLDSPLTTATFTQKSGYDAATDSIVTGGSTPSVPVFIEDAYYCYDHTSARYEQLKPGDKNISIKPASTPKAGDMIDSYKILSVDMISGGAFSCHCRL